MVVIFKCLPCHLVQGDGVGQGEGGWQWGCSFKIVLAEECSREHPSSLAIKGLGFRGEGGMWGRFVSKELPEGQAGIVREHPLPCYQMFIKYVFWVEYYAGCSWVREVGDTTHFREVSHSPLGDVLQATASKLMKTYEEKILILNWYSSVTFSVERQSCGEAVWLQ